MARVLNVGVGIFVLAFVWTLCLLLCLVLSRAKGAMSYASIGALALAGLITMILVLVPKEPKDPSEEGDVKVYDYSIIYRTILIAGCGLFLIAGFLLYIMNHVAEPIFAKPLRKIRA